MKVNFDEVKVYISLDKTQGTIQNVRKDFANLVYTQGSGIEAHALALKIYNGNAETEYNEQEIQLIRQFSQMCAPCMIDAFAALLEQNI